MLLAFSWGTFWFWVAVSVVAGLIVLARPVLSLAMESVMQAVGENYHGPMVQMEKVGLIRLAWERAGRPYCEHNRTDKEYHLGSDSGDLACLDCGLTWPRGDETPAPRGEPQTQ